MSSDDQKFKRLTEALEDHSAEGIAILSSQPSRLMKAVILSIMALLVAALIWSFIGRADVIVTATGSLNPDTDVKRFYAPIDGELVDIYVAEGMPVNGGDVLARLNARGAVQAATNALEAELKLSEAERESRHFPDRKLLMERQAKALKGRIDIASKQHEKRVSEGVEKLAESQRAKLEEARGNLEKAKRERDVARRQLQKFERLYRADGGGGVSKTQVEEKKSAALSADANFSLAEARLGELDFQLSEEYATAKSELEGSDQQLTELQIEYEELLEKTSYEENKVKMQLRSAQLTAEAASRIKFDNIDADNFLRIVAPVSGVITEMTYTQIGDKIQANTPLGGIAPGDSRAILKIEIQESDRAFLRVGQQVQMKFSAFPYQRYGFIGGTLEYISPSTQPSPVTKSPVFKGRVSLDRDYFQIGTARYPLRYGMAAIAEIVVRQRRLIDFALDPFRELAG